MVASRLKEKSIRTQHMLLGATVFGMVTSASVFAQGRFKTVGLKNINRQPCDLKASQDACEIGFFRGNPDKDENYSIIRAKAPRKNNMIKFSFAVEGPCSSNRHESCRA